MYSTYARFLTMPALKHQSICLQSRGASQGSGEPCSRKYAEKRDWRVAHPNLPNLVDTTHFHNSLLRTSLGKNKPRRNMTSWIPLLPCFFLAAHPTSQEPSKAEMCVVRRHRNEIELEIAATKARIGVPQKAGIIREAGD